MYTRGYPDLETVLCVLCVLCVPRIHLNIAIAYWFVVMFGSLLTSQSLAVPGGRRFPRVALEPDCRMLCVHHTRCAQHTQHMQHIQHMQHTCPLLSNVWGVRLRDDLAHFTLPEFPGAGAAFTCMHIYIYITLDKS